MSLIKRIRDPVHGLITFDFSNEVDKAAWRLIDTPEFQRLRRVKQLGVSEFTFPGATHTRLSHSIGVFHVARRLMIVAERYIPADQRSPSRMRTALLASLLHDIGHGPFSHAFENAEKVRLSKEIYRDHEDWTADLIQRKDGLIRKILKEEFKGDGSIADDIADMLKGKEQDLYSSVVSSSFDADRLDYLQRDRMMTGSGAGAIDFDWLLDNLRVVDVPANNGEDTDEPEGQTIQAFAFEEKALQAAENFILARFHLYSQVYFHKATRGIEQMLTKFLLLFSEEAAKGTKANLVVPKDHPLRAYYAKPKPDLRNYLALDDAVVWSALELSATKGNGPIREFAERICSRRIMKGVTIDMVNPQASDLARRKFIDQHMKAGIGTIVFEDRAPLSIYKDPSKEAVKPHKRVHIRREGGKVLDITSLSKPVASLYQEQEILRYYFLNETDRKKVLNVTGESHAAT
ncbi:HD domain-containing protein [Xanthobacter aminoxidans]|uniref:HD domain-containing protein n=1 Tax=Xanthobacter aminoxidans TaxID=186280 RepID=UPI0037295FE2